MNPRLEFTIGANRNTHLGFKVIVWRTYGQLQSARDKVRAKGEIPHLCDGFCHRVHNRHCNDRCIGEIHLSADRLTVETIAHECLHAAIGYAEWIRPADDKASEDSRDLVATSDAVEELLAYSTGFMTEGVIWNCRREKLKVKPL